MESEHARSRAGDTVCRPRPNGSRANRQDPKPARIRSETLAGDDSWQVRVRVARNRNTPVAVLTTLAADEYWYVRMAVAKHPNTPADVLTELADDPYRDVRIAALTALTQHTPAAHRGQSVDS